MRALGDACEASVAIGTEGIPADVGREATAINAADRTAWPPGPDPRHYCDGSRAAVPKPADASSSGSLWFSVCHAVPAYRLAGDVVGEKHLLEA